MLRDDLGALTKEIKKRTAWISNKDPEEDVQDALGRLRDVLGKVQKRS